MRYFLDTEFAERSADIVEVRPPDGWRSRPARTIQLISIGIVSENGREFYAESSEFREDDCNDWVRQNVLPHLGPFEKRWSHSTIAAGIQAFIGTDPEPEFWAYYADYDWVVFCWLWGDMVQLPHGFPKFCLDLQQWWYQLGKPPIKPEDPADEHNALADAHWNRELHDALAAHAISLRASVACPGIITP